MSPREVLPFADVIRHACRRARLTVGLEQAQLATRMANLGYPWHPQTVSNVENGKRRVTAEELLGLSLALETSVSYLLQPHGGLRQPPGVTVPSGEVLLPSAVLASVGNGEHQSWSIHWEGDAPVWPGAETLEELERLEQQRDRLEREFDEALLALAKSERADTGDDTKFVRLVEQQALEAEAVGKRRNEAERLLHELRLSLSKEEGEIL